MWPWKRQGRDVSHGADEARTAASEVLSAAQDRNSEVARVTREAQRQAVRSRRYLTELDRIYHFGRGRGAT